MKVIKFGEMYKFAIEVGKRRLVFDSNDRWEYYYDWVIKAKGCTSWQLKLKKYSPEAGEIFVHIVEDYVI